MYTHLYVYIYIHKYYTHTCMYIHVYTCQGAWRLFVHLLLYVYHTLSRALEKYNRIPLTIKGLLKKEVRTSSQQSIYKTNH